MVVASVRASFQIIASAGSLRANSPFQWGSREKSRESRTRKETSVLSRFAGPVSKFSIYGERIDPQKNAPRTCSSLLAD